MTGSLNWDNQVSSFDVNGGRGRAYGETIAGEPGNLLLVSPWVSRFQADPLTLVLK